MTESKLKLINEQTSPLQRIMWIYNVGEPAKRTFENNICTFHIGNGFFLSVAHNLRTQQGFYRSIHDSVYLKEILPKIDGSQKSFLDQCYFPDEYTQKRYLNNNDPANIEHIAKILKQKRFDTRWVTFAEKNICNPFIIFQFKENAFYGDSYLSGMFEANHRFLDNDAKKFTFLVEVELVKAFYNEDIALYRIIKTPPEIINKIPVADISYDFVDDPQPKFYCLQSSPGSPAGRLLNEAAIEGVLDHFNIFHDDIGGNYNLEGYRYLIRGYFRFGSSGAPYIYYDTSSDKFMANAIQSEASGIQLSIKNDREGNYQYVNAIASPLFTIKRELEQILSNNRNGGSGISL